MEKDKTTHILVRPESIRIFWRIGLLGLLILALLDLVIHTHDVFGIDGSFGFYSWYGLLTCFLMIIFSRFLGTFLKRRDDYYDS